MREDDKRQHAFRDDALGEHDATALAELIQKGKLSAREVTEAAIERIKTVDPVLHAVALETFDRGRRQSETPLKGAFAGVPTLIKDNIDIAGLPTGNGAKAAHPRPAAQDSGVVRQFLDQGFTLLGKSRLPEFGFSASTEFKDEPPTRNPWHTDYSSGASSGGAAALVASGAVPIAHGNDGGGSIRIPAACCGLVGFKGTRGRLVRSEVSQALPVNLICEGVLTRSVRDTVRFLNAAERHYRSPFVPLIGDVSRPIQRRMRVGLVLDSITGSPTAPEARAAVEDCARLLSDLGHRVEEMPPPVAPTFIKDFLAYYGMMAFMVRTFGKRIVSPDFNARELDNLTRGLSRYYRRRLLKTPLMLRRLRHSEAIYARSLDDFDVMLSPVLAHTTPELGYLSPTLPFDTLIDRLIKYVSFTPVNNATGTPAISLPMGHSTKGLPIGVQFATTYGNDSALLALALELEEARPWRRIQD